MRKPAFCIWKTKTQISFAVTGKLINPFVFATRIVQSLNFLNPKFQASSHLLYLYSLVCVGPGRKPERWFSLDTAHFYIKLCFHNGFFLASADVPFPKFVNICENKDADQLRGDREADQRLCFRYIDSTIPLLPKYKISSL